MIRLATQKDKDELALMLLAMYVELFQEEASYNMAVYQDEIQKHLDNPRDYIYVDEDYKGFFVVRDETEAMTPNLHRYNGIRVFIAKQYRRSPLLALFYSHLFHDFPDGDILGMTEINSDHIPVLDKRHELIAKVYKLKRSK